jgi:malate dehydrogenase
MHIAVIGVGRVGRPTAYTLLCAGLADTITVCDIKPGLAHAFAEELRHVAVSQASDIEINACEKDEEVAGADIILISAGHPRIPGVEMSRRDLATKNAEIVKYIAEATAPRNRGAKYIVITNPVDAMAMVCKKYSKAEFVISTGTNLESLRFRSKLAQTLALPPSKVRGWVGGEHGEAAVTLWSTANVDGLKVEEYAKSKGINLPKTQIESYIKSVSKLIIDNIGGTEYGPAASFRDIVRAIVKDTNENLSIAAPMKFEEMDEPVFVSIPRIIGRTLGPSIYNRLPDQEKLQIANAAKAIYQTYQAAVKNLK